MLGNADLSLKKLNHPLSQVVLKRMVARDGIEPPTPAFSGPRSTN